MKWPLELYIYIFWTLFHRILFLDYVPLCDISKFLYSKKNGKYEVLFYQAKHKHLIPEYIVNNNRQFIIPLNKKILF